MPERDYSATLLSRKLGAKPGVNVVVLFTTSADDLAKRFPALKRTLGTSEGLWVAWPKKASRLETDLDFKTVQSTGLAAGLVDNKSASITETYQGLQFVVRTRDRPA